MPERPGAEVPPRGPQSVGRIIAILEALVADTGGATLSELAKAARAPKTSLVGLLNAMVDEHCLLRDSGGRYVLGARMFGFAMRAVGGLELPELAKPFLADLVERTGETAVLGVIAGEEDRVVYVAKVESASPVRYAVAVGERREMHCTALGKLLLAHVEGSRLDRFLSESALTRFTPATIVSGSALKSELRRIRKEGIARTVEERFADASGLAAPVFDGQGIVIAGLLIAGPSMRMRTNREANERHLLQVAGSFTNSLGGRRG